MIAYISRMSFIQPKCFLQTHQNCTKSKT